MPQVSVVLTLLRGIKEGQIPIREEENEVGNYTVVLLKKISSENNKVRG